MAVGCELLTFPGQNFTPQDFSIMLDRVSIIKTGIIRGCRVSMAEGTTNTLNVSEGWVAVRGRLVKIQNGTISFQLPATGSVTYFLLVKVDLANTVAPATVYITDTLPSDETDDFNVTNGVAYCLLARIVTDPLEVKQVINPDYGTLIHMTMTASTWSNGVYRLESNLFTATSNQDIIPEVGITAAQLEAMQLANIQDAGQGAGYIDLKAYGDVPTINIPIRVLFRGLL